MKILLTNDDGVEAPGLQALRDAVDGLVDPVIIAPVDAASGCSHQTTTDRPLRVVKLEENRFSVGGTPADCVRIALHRFAPKVESVVAGINNGGNLGVDVYHSGTVAAAREAAIQGLRGIAISHYHARPLHDEDWRRAVKWAKPILAELLGRRWMPGTFWNINLPNPDSNWPEVVFCPLDPSPLPLSFREDQEMLHYSGAYSQRQRRAGTDVEVCFSGRIAVTEITVMEASR